MYVDKSAGIVNKYNNTYHRTIKMKSVDDKNNTYTIYFGKDSNNKYPKFIVGDHVRTLKYKNIFAKRYTLNWSQEVFVIKKVKNIVPWIYVIDDVYVEEIAGAFYEKELQKTNHEVFRIQNVIKRKRDKLYV